MYFCPKQCSLLSGQPQECVQWENAKNYVIGIALITGVQPSQGLAIPNHRMLEIEVNRNVRLMRSLLL